MQDFIMKAMGLVAKEITLQRFMCYRVDRKNKKLSYRVENRA